MASKNDIGVKAKADGLDEFRKGFRDTAKTMKELKSELELVKSQYDKNDKSLENLKEPSSNITINFTLV